MAETNGEKSHDPTPHRRQQAREEGHVVNSQDLSSATLLLGGLLVLLYCGAALVEFLGRLLSNHLGGEAWLVADDSAPRAGFNDGRGGSKACTERTMARLK